MVLEHFAFETLCVSTLHSGEKRRFPQNPRRFAAAAASASAEYFHFENALDAWLARLCPPLSGESLPEAVARQQLAALNAVLRRAGQSRFYGGRLPQALAALSALADLPFTLPADLARWGDLLCVSQTQVARMVSLTTSGTTGTPKRLAFTQGDLERTRDFFSAGMAQLVSPGQRVAVLLPGADRPHGVTDLLRQALPEAAVLPSTPADAGQARPHVLVLLPAQLRDLCRTPAWPELSGVLTSGEVLDNVTCGQAAAWLPHGLLLDHYGLTETCFGGGVECAAHAGYHLREADLLVEIVDPHGRPLPPGETGEVVVTTLHREAMPLIRYRTGDVSRLLSGPCPCGSPMQRLERVAGRLDQTENGSPGADRPQILPKGHCTAGSSGTEIQGHAD